MACDHLLHVSRINPDTWILGGAAAAQVATEIAEQITAVTMEDVLVTCDDGSVAFTLEQGVRS